MPRFQGTACIVQIHAGLKNANVARKTKEKCRVSKESHTLFGTSQVLKRLMQPVKAKEIPHFQGTARIVQNLADIKILMQAVNIKRNAAFPRNRTHFSEPRRS